MQSFKYILLGILAVLALVFLGKNFSSWPAGIFNSAQVLSVIVLAPSSGDTGGGSNGSPPKGGAPSDGGGGGGGGGVTPANNSTPPATTKLATGAKVKADINGDGKVDIADFSILAFWFKRTLTPAAIAQGLDLNSDGKVTLADFSILAFYWNK